MAVRGDLYAVGRNCIVDELYTHTKINKRPSLNQYADALT